MLENIIVKCDDKLWNDYSRDKIVGQIVYHAISSADVYLSKTRQERNSLMNKYGENGNSFNNPDKKLNKMQILDFLEDIKEKSNKRFNEITVEELSSESIFEWHETSVLGSLLYNLRHLMLHVGALHVRVNAMGKEPLAWVGKIYGDERDKWEEMNSEAISYYRKGDYKKAEKIFLDFVKVSNNPAHYYNLACCYSLDGKSDQALDALKSSLMLDKKDNYRNLAKTDKDFDKIRDQPEFKNLF